MENIKEINLPGGQDIDGVTTETSRYTLTPKEPEQCSVSAPAEQKRYERVAHGEYYWCIDSEGFIDSTPEMNLMTDYKSYAYGNYYHSQAEAGYFRDKQQLMSDIRRWKLQNGMSGGNEYSIVFRPIIWKLATYHYKYNTPFELLFPTETAAEKCIETFNDRLLDIHERGKLWE